MTVSNVKVYYELRSQHRRKIAQFTLELMLFAFIFYELSRLSIEPTLMLGLTFVSGSGAALGLGWMFANQNPGRVRQVMESIAGTQDWPADLRQRMEERGEL